MAKRFIKLLVASALALSLLLTVAGAPVAAHGVRPYGSACGGAVSTFC
jgi:hypothetical protein